MKNFFIKNILILSLVIFLGFSPLFTRSIFAQNVPAFSAVIGNVTAYDTSINIQGQVLGSYVTSPVLVYGISKIIPSSFRPFLPSPSGYFSIDIIGLSPLTTYYFQVADSFGGVALTDIRSIKTKNTLLDLSAKDITQTKATIIGRVSSLTNDLNIFVDTSGNGTFLSNFVPKIQSDKTFSFQLVNLNPATTYQFIAAKASDPTIRYSGVRTFTTLLVVSSPYVSVLGDKSVTIATKISEGAQSPVVVYGNTDASMSGNAPLTLADGLYTAKIDNLKPDTAYSYEIAGTSGGRLVSYSGIYHFLTSKTPSTTTPPTIGTIKDPNAGGSGTTKTFSGGIVPCEGGTLSNEKQGCDFSSIIKLIANIINFLLFIVAPAIATCVILYAGILLLTSGGSSENLTKAKSLFSKAIIGLILAMAAWIIVKFVMTQLGYNDTLFPYFY